MAEEDQALDAVEGDQPLGQLGVGGVVDVAVAGEGGDGGGGEAAQVHNRHGVLLGAESVRSSMGTFSGTFPSHHRV